MLGVHRLGPARGALASREPESVLLVSSVRASSFARVHCFGFRALSGFGCWNFRVYEV